ncbi:hypothetical protein EOB36_23250 [Mesorhizobium sp. M6A.T.Cr.TU.017.01.1.1]|uniref:hypothetical protein n=1 Tax=Mesorhizobium sp. M6A.T.Cr.TU.017.01.1.1 TaxID=2496774 RepID=UPI000FD1F0C7|nr:hypothetical protein [Mesorhizobium sp. M6A.T.Cr.TU.017.01.1.1]RUU98602.1 hypothetical protein EOB36_23250 [Mesorhizobium sp. M6A.T.Cr.TU.017.01.1.1]
MNYQAIRQLSAEIKVRATDLIALSPQNDPFYAGVAHREQAARWFAALWERFGWGAGVHLRRAHYLLVSQDPPVKKVDGEPYGNTLNDWKALVAASLAARYLRLIPTDALVDRRNPEPSIHAENETVAGTVPGVSVSFRYPTFEYDLPDDIDPSAQLYPPDLSIAGSKLPDGQPYLVELWVEKSTQNDILLPLANRFGVNLIVGVGEMSEVSARAAVERAIEANRPMRILYISDLDPGGRSMPAALARKIEFILRDAGLDLDIQLEPIMLLPEQCQHYRLPRTPLKKKERRGPKFEARHGKGATELDALEALYPGELGRIVEREVCRYIDPTLSRRCQGAYWDITRWLDGITEEVHAPYAEQLAALTTRQSDTLTDLQAAMEAAREELKALGEDARPLWQQISADLDAVMPEIDPEDVPSAKPANPHAEPLFDSRRGYLDQLDHYRRWQGRGGA